MDFDYHVFMRCVLWILLLCLSACGGGGSSVPADGATYCGVVTGKNRITGMVSTVHDGDTISIAGQSIRLDSIDAPELDQAYGHASRDHLAALVLNQFVTVTYTKTDLYDRVLGTVFKSDCAQVNLNQVKAGAAWYYEAYKCEIDFQQRNDYAAAQAAARSAGLGLWAAPAVAPWIYRNGVDAKVPTSCPNGDAPSF
jgi:endonuclease YncB( thermonuclease family)